MNMGKIKQNRLQRHIGRRSKAEKVKTGKRMMDKNQSLQILNRDTLKIIAAAAMLIDHIGWRFYPFINLKAQVFHVLGRITLPIMCLFLTEGYFYTRSKKRYGLRMLLFALLSQLPYTMFQGCLLYTSRCTAIPDKLGRQSWYRGIYPCFPKCGRLSRETG